MSARAEVMIRGFYGIVNVVAGGPDPLAAAAEMADAGCRVIQLRYKKAGTGELMAAARGLKRLSIEAGFALIIDDDARVAAAVGADGVQVGQNDMSCGEARAIVGPRSMVGVSTHNRDQLTQAVASGADYVGFGPVFATKSKATPDPVLGLEGLRDAVSLCSVPVVAIGGINLLNAADVVSTGVNALAAIEAIYRGPGIGAAVRSMCALFEARGNHR